MSAPAAWAAAAALVVVEVVLGVDYLTFILTLSSTFPPKGEKVRDQPRAGRAPARVVSATAPGVIGELLTV